MPATSRRRSCKPSWTTCPPAERGGPSLGATTSRRSGRHTSTWRPTARAGNSSSSPDRHSLLRLPRSCSVHGDVRQVAQLCCPPVVGGQLLYGSFGVPSQHGLGEPAMLTRDIAIGLVA